MLMFSIILSLVLSLSTAVGKMSADTENKISKSESCVNALNLLKKDVKSSEQIVLADNKVTITIKNGDIVYEIDRKSVV